jgi:hypothetical protein
MLHFVSQPRLPKKEIRLFFVATSTIIMDQTPSELWEKIDSFACTDTGFTGHSLSLVSKYVQETSKSVKLQSINLCGFTQMLAFTDLLEQTPPHLQHVQYMLIMCCRTVRSASCSGGCWHGLFLTFYNLQML